MLADFQDALRGLPLSTVVTGGGAAFVAFLAGLAFANGVMKQLINMVCIGLGVSVAWYSMRHRVEMFGPSAASMGTDRLVIFSGVAGLLGYGISRAAMQLLSVFGIFKLFGGLAGWKGLAISIIPSGFLLWVASMGLRLVGNLYGMETAAAVGREGTRITSSFGGVVDTLRKALEKSSIGSMLLDVDPLAMRPTANLTRLLIVWPDQRLWPQLAANPKTAAVFSHPKVATLGYDASVRKLIDSKDYTGLMQLPKVEEVALYPDLQPLLNDVGLEDAMDQILYGRAPPKKK